MEAKTRHQVVLFLVLLTLLSTPFYLYLFFATTPTWSSRKALLFMWCPGLAALLTRFIFARNVRSLGWAWGRSSRYLGGAFVVPYVLCALVYVTVWGLGLGSFDPTRFVQAAARLGVSPHVLVLLLPVLLPLGTTLSTLSTLGEELGWRGFLAPRVVGLMGFTKASLFIGVVWAFWHYPTIMVLLPRYWPGLPVAYATACFTTSVVAVSFFYTWLRLRSGSVWPAVVLHAASNGAQESFEGLTGDTGPTHYLTFEYGIGFVIVIVTLLLLFGKRLARASAAATLSQQEAA